MNVSTVRPSALLVHIRSKEPRIFLAVHDFLHEPEQRTCRRRRFRLACSSGCAAFGVPAEAPAAPSFATLHCQIPVQEGQF